jgi:hypothetical protein
MEAAGFNEQLRYPGVSPVVIDSHLEDRVDRKERRDDSERSACRPDKRTVAEAPFHTGDGSIEGLPGKAKARLAADEH